MKARSRSVPIIIAAFLLLCASLAGMLAGLLLDSGWGPLLHCIHIRSGCSARVHACTPKEGLLLMRRPVVWFALATTHETLYSEFLANIDVAVMPSVAVGGGSSAVTGATVRIEGNYQVNYDTLSLNYIGGAHLSSAFDRATGVLRISGNAVADEYERILRSVYFRSSSRSEAPRRVAWCLGADTIYNAMEGRYVQYISTAGRSPLSWNAARDACAASSRVGLIGYLAAPSTAYAVRFLLMAPSVDGAGWIGASDWRTNGDWRLVGGPMGSEDGGFGRRMAHYSCGYYPTLLFANNNAFMTLPDWFQTLVSSSLWLKETFVTPLTVVGMASNSSVPLNCQWRAFAQYAHGWEWMASYTAPYLVEGGAPNARLVKWVRFWFDFLDISNCTASYSHTCLTVSDLAWAAGQPSTSQNTDYAVLNMAGTLKSTFAADSINGYYCEYGGLGPAPTFHDQGPVIVRPRCSFYLNEGACSVVMSCWWNVSVRKCVDQTCFQHGTPSSCLAAEGCEWGASGDFPEACAMKGCWNSYQSPSACDADASCVWEASGSGSGSGGGCSAVMCSLLTSSCACSSRPLHCFYDASFVHPQPSAAAAERVGQCVALSYALCPSVDILFALQGATTSDGGDYRAQAGALRRWAPTVPWAGTGYGAPPPQSSHGLRAALFVWNRAATVAYYSQGAPSASSSYRPEDFPSAADPMTGLEAQLAEALAHYDGLVAPLQAVGANNVSYIGPALDMARRMVAYGTDGDARRPIVVLFLTRHIQYIDGASIGGHADWIGASRQTLRFLAAVTGVLSPAIELPLGHISPLSALARSPEHDVRYLSNGAALAKALSGMCTAGSSAGWEGALVPPSGAASGRMGACSLWPNGTMCALDDGCRWDGRACQVSPCLCLEREEDCAANTRCVVGHSGMCRQMRCELYGSSQSACDQRGASCRWEDTVDGGRCVMRACVAHLTRTLCASDPAVCVWAESSGNCREDMCNVGTRAACVAVAGGPCFWNFTSSSSVSGGGGGQCREEPCNAHVNATMGDGDAAMAAACRADVGNRCIVDLDYSGAHAAVLPLPLTCRVGCSSHATVQACDGDSLCAWDDSLGQSVGGCVESYCSAHRGAAACDAVAACEYSEGLDDRRQGNAGGGVCVERQCASFKTATSCMAHADGAGCYWASFPSGAAGECRPVDWHNATRSSIDVFVALDASLTMAGSVGGYSQAFAGLVVILKRWVKAVPLTNTKAGQFISANATAAGGFRVLFYQFGHASSVVSGHLTGPSGDRKELLDELDWHMDNFKRFLVSSLYVCPLLRALLRDIPNAEVGGDGASSRRSVVIIFVFSQIGDVSRCAPPRVALQSLASAVLVVGLIAAGMGSVRPLVQTGMDSLAEPHAQLAMGLNMTSIGEALLRYVDDWAADVLYDPSRPLTPSTMDLEGPCPALGASKLLCLRDAYCGWAEDARLCPREGECSNIGCRVPMDARPLAPYSCANCRLAASDGAVECQYDMDSRPLVPAPRRASCVNHNCTRLYGARAECEGADRSSNADGGLDCEWDDVQRRCQRKVCRHPTRALCEGDPVCAWDWGTPSPHCRRSMCSGIVNATECWSAAVNGAQTLCLWVEEDSDAGVGACVENPCPLGTFLDCERHPSGMCRWDYSLAPPMCRRDECAEALRSVIAGGDDADDGGLSACAGLSGSFASPFPAVLNGSRHVKYASINATCEWNGSTRQCRERACVAYAGPAGVEAYCAEDVRCTAVVVGAAASSSGGEVLACRESRCYRAHGWADGGGDGAGGADDACGGDAWCEHRIVVTAEPSVSSGDNATTTQSQSFRVCADHWCLALGDAHSCDGASDGASACMAASAHDGGGGGAFLCIPSCRSLSRNQTQCQAEGSRCRWREDNISPAGAERWRGNASASSSSCAYWCALRGHGTQAACEGADADNADGRECIWRTTNSNTNTNSSMADPDGGAAMCDTDCPHLNVARMCMAPTYATRCSWNGTACSPKAETGTASISMSVSPPPTQGRSPTRTPSSASTATLRGALTASEGPSHTHGQTRTRVGAGLASPPTPTLTPPLPPPLLLPIAAPPRGGIAEEARLPVSNAAGGFVVGAGAIGGAAPTTGGKLAVANAMARLASCDDGDDSSSANPSDLPVFVHPLQFTFGGSRVGALGAAIVSNCLIIPLLIAIVVMGPMQFVVRRIAMTRTSWPMFLAMVGWPSLLLTPFAALAEGIAFSATAAIFTFEPAGVAVGVLGWLACAGIVVSWVYVLVVVLPRRSLRLVPVVYDAPPRGVGERALRLISPAQEWAPCDASTEGKSCGKKYGDDGAADISHQLLPSSSADGDGGRKESPQEGSSSSSSAPPSSSPPSVVVTEEAMERYGNTIGDQRVYWGELLCFVCSLAVGLLEGIPDGKGYLPCEAKALLALGAVAVQCVLSVLTLIRVEVLLQGLLSVVVMALSIVVTVQLFLGDDDDGDAEEEGTSGVALSTLSVAGNLLGLALMLVGLMRGAANAIGAYRAEKRAADKKGGERSGDGAAALGALMVPQFGASMTAAAAAADDVDLLSFTEPLLEPPPNGAADDDHESIFESHSSPARSRRSSLSFSDFEGVEMSPINIPPPVRRQPAHRRASSSSTVAVCVPMAPSASAEFGSVGGPLPPPPSALPPRSRGRGANYHHHGGRSGGDDSGWGSPHAVAAILAAAARREARMAEGMFDAEWSASGGDPSLCRRGAHAKGAPPPRCGGGGDAGIGREL